MARNNPAGSRPPLEVYARYQQNPLNRRGCALHFLVGPELRMTWPTKPCKSSVLPSPEPFRPACPACTRNPPLDSGRWRKSLGCFPMSLTVERAS